MHIPPRFDGNCFPRQTISVVKRYHGYKICNSTNEGIYLRSVSVYLFRRILLFRYYVNSAK